MVEKNSLLNKHFKSDMFLCNRPCFTNPFVINNLYTREIMPQYLTFDIFLNITLNPVIILDIRQ